MIDKIDKFRATVEDIKALKRFIDDSDLYGEDALKLQLLSWMWDNMGRIRILALGVNKMHKWEQFHRDVYTWLRLIGIK